MPGYFSCWCTNCKAVPKQTCVQEGHAIGDFKMDLPQIVHDIEEIQTAACNIHKLVVSKNAKVHQHWQNQVEIADAAVEQAIATQQLAMEKEKEAKTRLDEWKLKSERCEKRKRQSCVNSNVTGFGTIKEKITKTLREAEKGDREINNILKSLCTAEEM